MAISKNLYTRGLKQRLAGAVWYNRKGATVVRELAAQVSNPKSTAQMEQRARLANLVAVYRANQFWMHWGSFENKKKNWSDYNAFVSANQSVLPVYLTKSMAASGATVVAGYKVSSGSLPRVNCVAVSDVIVSDIFIGDLNLTSATTIGDLSSAILNNNNFLMEGDQLSAIINIQQSNNGIPYVAARAYELILNTANVETLESAGLDCLTSDTLNGNDCLAILLPSEQCGATFVISREDSSKLLVSTQELVLTTAQETYLESYRTSSAKAASFNSYGANKTKNFLSSGYSSEGSEGVSLPQQIMSVNGKVAGQYCPITQDTDITIVMAREVASDSEILCRFYESNNTQYPITVSADGTNTITGTWDGIDFTPSNLELVVNGVTYTMQFSTQDPGEITE